MITQFSLTYRDFTCLLSPDTQHIRYSLTSNQTLPVLAGTYQSSIIVNGELFMFITLNEPLQGQIHSFTLPQDIKNEIVHYLSLHVLLQLRQTAKVFSYCYQLYMTKKIFNYKKIAKYLTQEGEFIYESIKFDDLLKITPMRRYTEESDRYYKKKIEKCHYAVLYQNGLLYTDNDWSSDYDQYSDIETFIQSNPQHIVSDESNSENISSEETFTQSSPYTWDWLEPPSYKSILMKNL